MTMPGFIMPRLYLRASEIGATVNTITTVFL